MPLDAVCLQAVVTELRPQVEGLRIDKIYQPSRDQVILMLRGSRRLLLCASGGAPRLQMTSVSRENPAEPPMFCMLLRKHLAGGRIAALRQPIAERQVEFELDVLDEFGQPGKRYLILECMGRRSNLILLDGERRIVDCLHRVYADLTATPERRQVGPGWFYRLPDPPDKCPFPSLDETGFCQALETAQPERKLDQFLMDTCYGLSPLLARELAYRTTGDVDSRLCALDAAGRGRFWEVIRDLQLTMESGAFRPVILRSGEDFSCIPIRQYGAAAVEECGDFSALLDGFYMAQEQRERVRQRGSDLLKTVSSARDRLRRKLAMQEKDYAAALDREPLRVCGDLITANLYRMSRGDSRLIAENFYAEDGGSIMITLDPLLTPQQNAAKYYKRYKKAKAAEQHLREQLSLGRQELEYLESVLAEIADAETEQDFVDIRSELREAGYGRQRPIGKSVRRASRPREFRTSGGYRVLVGRNNRQNDELTKKTASRSDIWLHTQKHHGSHVILCTGGRIPDDADIVEAAQIAAWYSQARDSDNVPVDYTLVRHVKKPVGARPGMVIYTDYRTVYVTPKAEDGR